MPGGIIIKLPDNDKCLVTKRQTLSLCFLSASLVILAKLDQAPFNCVAFAQFWHNSKAKILVHQSVPGSGEVVWCKFAGKTLVHHQTEERQKSDLVHCSTIACVLVFWCTAVGVVSYKVKLCSRIGGVLVFLCADILVHTAVVRVVVFSQRNGYCSAEPSFTGHAPCTAYHSTHISNEETRSSTLKNFSFGLKELFGMQ